MAPAAKPTPTETITTEKKIKKGATTQNEETKQLKDHPQAGPIRAAVVVVGLGRWTVRASWYNLVSFIITWATSIICKEQ
jgi:hypothetical protein